ncbi:thrombospondin type-1 domain-containing protein 7B-like [Amphiura filiformis]|uniref:thrombospondin type-1 domain-containing protein 7B-like n=1 Tax=Amphiura filiformis TaxID=82378 RepID=UPI003B21775B
MSLPRTGLNMEYLAMGSVLLFCMELSLFALVNGGDVVSPSGYLWITGKWGKCQGDQCGYGGTQNRAMWCEHIEGWTAKSSDCDLMSVPERERTCFKVCAEHAELFEWQVEEWGPCERDVDEIVVESPTSSDACGEKSLGFQYRKVKCVEKSTTYIQRPHESFISNEVCRELHPEPIISQECITPCAQDCIVTQFTPWTECTSTCGNGTQTRTRRVVLPPSRGGWQCLPLSQTRVCEDIPLCEGEQVYTYSFKIGPWGECERFETEDPEVMIGGRGFPLIGMQNRDIWCIQSDGAEVKLSKCLTGHRSRYPAKYQACIITQNCEVSQWSDWSSCPVMCPHPDGITYTSQDRPTAYRIRSRQVEQLSLGAGKLCPNLEERQPCRIEEGVTISTEGCPRYTWHTGGWSECSVSAVMSQRQAVEYAKNRTLCGGGLHKRHVYCIRMNDTVFTPVPDELCESSSKPPSNGECSVPCPKDCKVSAWGPWSGCKTTSCSVQSYKREKGHRIRTRDIMMQPDIGGQECPHLAEFLPCDIHMCYEWAMEPIEECIIKTGDYCGEGTQQHRVTCVGPDRTPVSDRDCASTISEDKPMVEQPCTIPCPDDCVLTEWGPWSACSQSCGKGGTETRRRSILARNKPGSKECPDEELVEERLCNSHSCVGFAWMATGWTACQSVNTAYHIPPNHLIEGITCGVGRQTRIQESVCVRVSNFKEAPDKRCSDMNKPPISQQCKIPCPTDCEVSEFGEWSPCPETCPEGRGDNFFQTRQRYILKHAVSGGAVCPALTENRLCIVPSHCFKFNWIPSDWSLCKPVSEENGIPRLNEDDQKCGMGLKTRERRLYPYGVDECLKYSGPMPASSEPCHLPCDDDCEFKEWGKWTDCQNNCQGEQIRRRKSSGKSRKKAECNDGSNHALIEYRSCTCPTFELVPAGRESNCILNANSALGDCGFGLRYRARQCRDENERIMPFSYCGSDSEEFTKSVCDIACPRDCQLSPWSEWGECSQVTESVGQRTRRREILDRPRNGNNGRPCPAHDGEGYLYENKPCQLFNDSNVEYYWSAEMWRECNLDYNNAPENATCGSGGFQRRTVRCIMKSPSGFMGWTNHSMCDLDSKPEETRECTKPCPGECVVSEWGEWSICPGNCNLVSFRHRTREIIRELPPEEEENLCLDEMEQQQCMLGINCYEYVWNVTAWSTCELKPGAVCGEGTMTRILQCKEKNEAGNVVDMSYCEERLAPFNQPLEGKCHVGCSIDCLLSEWSQWTKCSDVCGPDVGQVRTRKVLREPAVLGRPCSTQLQQQRPCKAMPCFQWVMSEWSECIAQDGDCGMGIRTRNLSCTRNDGIVVEESFCIGNKPYNSNFNVTEEGMELLERTQLCTIPCPGECQHTQWSPWSKCHVYCHQGRPIGSEGIEARSKAALESYQGTTCPGDKINTRPCNGNTCYQFTWEMGPWILGHRDVWCQRSDKLNVTGACSIEDKPSSDAICEPLCTVPHSYCSQTGDCECTKNYDPKFSEFTGKLSDCSDPEWMPKIEDPDPDMPPYRKTPSDGSGSGGPVINIKPDPKKTDEDEKPSEKNVFGAIPVWAFAIGGVFIVFILCLIIASCCACRSCRKKEEQPKKKEPTTDDFAIYWDETAKKRYNGEVDL